MRPLPIPPPLKVSGSQRNSRMMHGPSGSPRNALRVWRAGESSLDDGLLGRARGERCGPRRGRVELSDFLFLGYGVFRNIFQCVWCKAYGIDTSVHTHTRTHTHTYTHTRTRVCARKPGRTHTRARHTARLTRAYPFPSCSLLFPPYESRARREDGEGRGGDAAQHPAHPLGWRLPRSSAGG